MRCTCLVWACAILLAACGKESPDKPYFEFAGGGFVFNYNIAEAYYGFVVRATRRIPDDTMLEAEFENPAGGEPFVVQQPAIAGRAEYVFRSPGVQGVVAGREYRVELRLIDPVTHRHIAAYSRAYRSSADQAVLPKTPTTIGPGYRLNPDSELLFPRDGAPASVGKGDKRQL